LGRSTQVQVAILQPRLLPHRDPLIDLERQRSGRVEHLQGRGDNLDLPRRQVGVSVALRTGAHLAGDPHAILVANVMATALLEHLVAGHDLDDSGRIPQIEERHTAVIASLGHPTREGDGLAGVGGTQRAGLVGAKHGRCPSRCVRSVLGMPPARLSGQPTGRAGDGAAVTGQS
jgi:hypothetical protein